MGHLKNRYGLTLVLCAFLAISGVFSPVRAMDPLPPCDSEFMDAIEARGWLMAQRRISQNQNFIFKPDSVIEYSCFNQLIGWLSTNPGGRRFSENYPIYPQWGPIGGIDEFSLDFALFEQVYKPMIQYMAPNFGHTYLGGRIIDAGGTAPPWGEYNCDAMQHVWHRARCIDFIEDNFGSLEGEYILSNDDFYDFPWYAVNDPRTLPAEYGICEPLTDMINAAMIETYRGEGQDGMHGDEWLTFVLLDENNPYILDGLFYFEDPILAIEILELVLPNDCPASAMVPTGVMVEIPRLGGWQEHICSKPGCSFDGAQCVP